MLFFVAAPAFAYELIGFDWTWQDNPLELPIVLDDGSFPPGFADPDDLEENLIQATEAWSDTKAAFAVDYGGRVSGPTNDAIRVYYVDSSTGGLLGAALTGSVGAEMQACEIQVYRANGQLDPIPWSFAPDEADLPFEQFDFQTVMLHELGHCFGLNHTDVGGAIMLPASINGTATRLPHADDEAGLVAMYGKAKGCSTAPGGALGLFALPLLALRRRR
ncbi:MAG: matrixin family metalloprotease [Alphaproteobacteria bacterium]|nr:matrixin family metalloprotease [Alphaproteobacteria bacterium]